MIQRDIKPSHPGELIRETIDSLREETGYNFTMAEIANGLGVTRTMLANIVNEHHGITTDMCVRLSEAFGTSPEFWLNVQGQYDLWHSERIVKRSKIKHFLPVTGGR